MQHIEDISHRRELRANKFSKLIVETELKIKLARDSLPLVEVKLLEETNEPEKTVVHVATTLD